MVTLSANAVDVWLTETSDVRSEDLDASRKLLSPDEIARNQSFRLEKDRTLDLCARVHLRRVLSNYARLAPEGWDFRVSDSGRPEIANAGFTWLHFNLSHTAGLVASAVSLNPEIGIDVEYTGTVREIMEVARVAFTQTEIESLQAIEASERSRRFFELWTLKEAYAKATGQGAKLDFRLISFQSGPGGVEARFDPSLDDNPREWHFEIGQPTPVHQLAVAVRLPVNSAPALRFETIRL